MSCDKWLSKKSQKPKRNKAERFNDSYIPKISSHLHQTLMDQYFSRAGGKRTLQRDHLPQEQLEFAKEKQLSSEYNTNVDSKVQSDVELTSEIHLETLCEGKVHHSSEGHDDDDDDDDTVTHETDESSEVTSFSEELREFSMELNMIESRWIGSETQT